MTTVRKNSKDYKALQTTKKGIVAYSLYNDFHGQAVSEIPAYVFEGSKIRKTDKGYTIHVHSNLWYEVAA